jgi:hypothetical protein
MHSPKSHQSTSDELEHAPLDNLPVPTVATVSKLEAKKTYDVLQHEVFRSIMFDKSQHIAGHACTDVVFPLVALSTSETPRILMNIPCCDSSH